MDQQVLQAIAIPFLGTVLGAGCVFVMGEALPEAVRRPVTNATQLAVPVSTVNPSWTPVCFGTMYTGGW